MVGLNVIVGAAVGDLVGDDVGANDNEFTVAVVSTIAPQSARNVCIALAVNAINARFPRSVTNHTSMTEKRAFKYEYSRAS